MAADSNDGSSGSVRTYEAVASTVNVYTETIMDYQYMCGYMSQGARVTAASVGSITGSNGVTYDWCKITSVVSGTTSGVLENKYAPISSETTTMLSLASNNVTTSTNTEDEEEEDEDEAKENYMDEAFLTTLYTTYVSEDEYVEALGSGLRFTDLRGIIGIPHQFLPSVDPRIDGSMDNVRLGRTYTQNIIKRIPLLLMTPGMPNFKSSFSSDARKGLISGLAGTGITIGDLDTLLDGESGKYYTLRFAYTAYYEYVNAMLRSAAMFLEIGDIEINSKPLRKYNWLYWNSDTETNDTVLGNLKSVFAGNTDVWSNDSLRSLLGPYVGCVAIYADPGATVDDSFSNSTTTSQLASSMNSLSDTGRELNFLVGNIGSLTGLGLTNDTGLATYTDTIDSVIDSIDNSLGSGNIMSNILNKANTILAGGRLIFPEIWSDSSFSRSYSLSMKCIAGSGAKLSVFFDILVPIYFLLGFVLPRQSESTGQSYYTPFLVRAFHQGAFNVDMGIITSLNITKGAEGEWTVDGLPTVANISFDIKDLYEGMFMSPQISNASMGVETTVVGNIMTNIAELDYIANSCGVNINDQEIWRTIRMSATLGFGTYIGDTASLSIFGGISKWFNQRLNNIFGVF